MCECVNSLPHQISVLRMRASSAMFLDSPNQVLFDNRRQFFSSGRGDRDEGVGGIRPRELV